MLLVHLYDIVKSLIVKAVATQNKQIMKRTLLYFAPYLEYSPVSYRAIKLRPGYCRWLKPPAENAPPLKRAPGPFRVLWRLARS
jgi:hypothetical protein